MICVKSLACTNLPVEGEGRVVVSGSLEMVLTSLGGSSMLEQRGGKEGIGVSFNLIEVGKNGQLTELRMQMFKITPFLKKEYRDDLTTLTTMY